MNTYDRRTFLRRAGLAGAGLVLAPGVARALAAPDECLAPFLHGVASGDPLPDGIVLWTRVTTPDTAPVPVAWRIASDVGLQDVVATGDALATPERDHTVKVFVTGLEPGHTYFYAFEAGGQQSLIARTRTAPAAGVEHLRFGVVSCSSYQHGYFNGYAALARREDLDAIIHLGDYVYEYGPGEYGDLRDHAPPVEMTRLEHYRTRYAQYHLDPDLRRLHQLYPFITTWDDHESADNSWRDGATNHQPTEGPWAQRKAWSQQAYDEWIPARTAAPDTIYRTLHYGDLCDVILLDTRLEGRDEPIAAVDPGLTLPTGEIDDPDRHIISPAQMAWFQGELSASQRRGTRWRIVCQQVCIGQWNLPGLPDAVVGVELPDAPVLGLRDDGNGLNPDSWDGYTADRDRVLDHIANDGIDNVVVLTGDVHSSWAMELSKNPADLPSYTPHAVEFVAPSITSPGLEDVLGPATPVFQALISNPLINPHIKMMDTGHHGYVLLDVRGDAVQADWYFVHTIVEPSTSERHFASWQVATGTPRLISVDAPAAAGQPAPAIPPPDPVCGPASSASGSTLPATGADGPLRAVAGAAALLGAAAAVRGSRS